MVLSSELSKDLYQCSRSKYCLCVTGCPKCDIFGLNRYQYAITGQGNPRMQRVAAKILLPQFSPIPMGVATMT